jgi:hypothetical protein
LCYSEQPQSDEPETNARLLERLRSDPEHFARLQADQRAFGQLPPERQDRLRELDQQLHNTDSITQKRLWSVMERYTAWYDHLSEAARHRIDQATDRHERLAIVTQYREDQWLARQPHLVRDEIAKVPVEKRHDEIANRRKDERQRFATWMRAMRVLRPVPGAQPAKPVRASDFPPDGVLFINQVLGPQLTQEDREHLKKLEGKWPYYTQMVLELSEKERYRPKLPGTTGPINFDGLPKEYKGFFKSRVDMPAHLTTTSLRDKWPDFAIAVTEEVRRTNSPLLPLGPARATEFPALVRQFVETALVATLSDKETSALHEAAGRWPEYPKKVLELAEHHGLEVPLMRMPNAADWRKKVDAALPEVPDRILHDFALNDLTADERANLKLSVSDPESRDRLVEEYFRKYPNEMTRLKRLDRQMLLDGGKPTKTKPGL